MSCQSRQAMYIIVNGIRDVVLNQAVAVDGVDRLQTAILLRHCTGQRLQVTGRSGIVDTKVELVHQALGQSQGRCNATDDAVNGGNVLFQA